MYRPDDGQITFFDITLSDTFDLDPNNRWVQKAKIVPWAKAEEKYMHMFRKNGRPAKSIRMALGALIIQQTKELSDEETVQEIMESPYLQHFIGMPRFSNEQPFDPSLMTWFRKRLSAKFMSEINDEMCKAEAMPKEITPPEDDDDEPHGGTLIVDATCAPADITYPTDTGLLHDAVEKSEKLIDILHKPNKGKIKRPRTYRKTAQKVFKRFIKNRKPNKKAIRKCKKQLLGFLRRNLGIIDEMCDSGVTLGKKDSELLQILDTVYKQQDEMYQAKTNSIPDRIVSISQPHIRPIVRGKAGCPVEFGAKIDMSVVNGYVFLNEISYDAFNEGGLLEIAIMDYYKRLGILPKEILADRIYQTKDNRKLCKELKIRLMGKPLGRPKKDSPEDGYSSDSGRRNEVEGKFGTLKNHYGWRRIMARLPDTGKTAIAVAAFALNLKRRAKALLRFFQTSLFCRCKPVLLPFPEILMLVR